MGFADSNGSAHECSALATEILSYMALHPDAEGTLEDIVEWWLLEQEIRRGTRQVQSALRELIELGLVVPTTLRGRTHYRINETRWPEIRRICRQWEDSAEP